MTIDLYDRRRWETEPVRMPIELWRKLDAYIADRGSEGFEADFPLRDRTRGGAIRAIVEEWLGQREAKQAER